mgnify:FL=1
MRKVNEKMVSKMIVLKKKGLHIYEISKRFNINDRTVNKYTKNFPHPNQIAVIKEIPDEAKKFSKEKSEILGYLCSEGCENIRTYTCNAYDNRRGKSYLVKKNAPKILFSNTEKILQKRFTFLMKEVYNYKLKPDKKGNFYIARAKVRKDLNNYGNFGSKIWSIPKKLFEPKYKKQAIHFIRAFCDGDATIERKQKEVRIDSTNHNALIELSKLINYIGIPNKCYKFTDRSRIIIKDIKNYLNLISFIHPKKSNDLKNLIYRL